MVDRPSLRVVFFGTPDFAVPTLERLLASSHPVVAVVTQPDRPRGRGQHVSDAPVKAAALAAGVPVLQPSTLRDPGFLAELAAFNADLGVVAAYGKILNDAVLATPRLGLINVHASLLPRYRGAAPIHRAVIAGERETGVTIMRVVKALDAGAMLATATRAIGNDETSADVERHLAVLGAGLLLETVDRLALGPLHEEPQDETASTYANRLTKEDGIVDWTRPATALHNLVRGLHPWPHAFSYLRSRRVILLRSAALNEPSESGSLQESAVEPGTVVRADTGHFHVATGHGVLALFDVQPEGKRPMSVRDFLAGQRVAAGERFSAHP